MNRRIPRITLLPHWALTAAMVLMAIHLPLTTAVAQESSDSITVFNESHPLVYEDAWDLWPYVFLNENGEPDGYNVDLLRLIFKRLDIPFIIRLKPTSDALIDLKAGKSDLMLGMDAHFHDDYCQYSKSIVHLFTHSVLHQKDREPRVKRVKDLATNSVIVHEGSFSHHLMKDKGWGANAIGYNDMKEAIQQANTDKTSEIVWNTMSLKWLMQKYQLRDMQLSRIEIPHGEYKFMANNRQLLNLLDSMYSILLAEEQLQPIQNKWFYPERTESGLPAWIWKLAAGIAFLALLTLIYYFFYRYREKELTKDLRRQNERLALVLKTSNVRFWTYDIPSKTFTWMDEHGKAVRSYTVLEFSQRYQRPDFEQLTAAINQIVRQEIDHTTLDLRAKNASEGGEDREFTISLAVLRRNKYGRPTVILGTRSDITEEKQLQQAAQNTLLRYQAIFNTSMVDMMYFDENGVMIDMNDKASRSFDKGKEEILAEHITLQQSFGKDEIDLQDLDTTHVTQLMKKDPSSPFMKHLRKDEMFYEIKIVPVYNQEHRLMGIYGTGRDVSEVVNSYNQKQENLRQLQLANEEVTSYIQNINNVLKMGGIRMVYYSGKTHMVTIFSEIGRTAHELTQTRVLSLTCDRDKHTVQRLLNSMDSRSTAPIEATIETVLKVKSRPLCLQIRLVPIASKEGTAEDFFGMCRDVSDIKHTEKQLEKETLRAQEVEVVKNAFLRNMSYEIRTPLNAVVGFAELFQMEHSSSDESIFIEEIKDNSRSLLKLINNILFLSRLDAQMIDINPQPTDFAQIFDMHCNTSWENLRQPGVDYRIDNPYEQIVVDIDAQNVGIIIDQIVQNACQHTTKGSVRARIDYIGDRLVMAVDDTGAGIAEELLPTIFERFATGANTGSGLGLSICYELTQLMGGTINISSKIGRGTTVWVSLPCKATDITRKY